MIVPPPAPSVIKIMSPGVAPFLAVGGYWDTPTLPTALTRRSPKTMSPPTRRVLPATRGTSISSDTAQTPAVKSNNLPTSPSSARCRSLKIATGSAPITQTSLKVALVT